MDSMIEINGIKLCRETQTILKRWQIGGNSHKSDPELYVEYLSETQDCLTRLMLESGKEVNEISNLLTKLIQIKDDLKIFNYQNQKVNG